MQKLILDIRGNSGGLLQQAIAISNEFLPADKMIVYTQDRAGNRETQYSDGQGEFTDEQLVVLIDEYSASSSEILAGALQDNDRGTIIGRRSYGKGLVQSQIPFPDGFGGPPDRRALLHADGTVDPETVQRRNGKLQPRAAVALRA